jgi:hypothetical protein
MDFGHTLGIIKIKGFSVHVCLIPLTFVALILPCRRSRSFLRGALRPAPNALFIRRSLDPGLMGR